VPRNLLLRTGVISSPDLLVLLFSRTIVRIEEPVRKRVPDKRGKRIDADLLEQACLVCADGLHAQRESLRDLAD